jgi:hypothetical protein
MVSEDENMSELVDKVKVKGMQKEIKLLEKRKMKMEKLYEKMCGKSYTQTEVIDEDISEEPSEEYMEARSKAEARIEAGGAVSSVVKDYPKFADMLLNDLGGKEGRPDSDLNN